MVVSIFSLFLSYIKEIFPVFTGCLSKFKKFIFLFKKYK